MRKFAIPAFLALLACAGGAHAHARLLSATPAANSSVARPATVQLRFSERLVPAFSGADLAMTAKPGTTAVKVGTAAAVGADGRTLVLTPRSPLAAGRYIVAWRAVSTDTHRVTGRYAFTVR